LAKRSEVLTAGKHLKRSDEQGEEATAESFLELRAGRNDPRAVSRRATASQRPNEGGAAYEKHAVPVAVVSATEQ